MTLQTTRPKIIARHTQVASRWPLPWARFRSFRSDLSLFGSFIRFDETHSRWEDGSNGQKDAAATGSNRFTISPAQITNSPLTETEEVLMRLRFFERGRTSMVNSAL